jgi:hypothetical protein
LMNNVAFVLLYSPFVFLRHVTYVMDLSFYSSDFFEFFRALIEWLIILTWVSVFNSLFSAINSIGDNLVIQISEKLIWNSLNSPRIDNILLFNIIGLEVDKHGSQSLFGGVITVRCVSVLLLANVGDVFVQKIKNICTHLLSFY